MGVAPKKQASGAIWEQPDADLVCLLCGATVGETFGPRIVHRAACPKPLIWQGRRPRCCQCGGPLICDPAAYVWGAGPRPSARVGARPEEPAPDDLLTLDF